MQWVWNTVSVSVIVTGVKCSRFHNCWMNSEPKEILKTLWVLQVPPTSNNILTSIRPMVHTTQCWKINRLLEGSGDKVIIYVANWRIFLTRFTECTKAGVQVQPMSWHHPLYSLYSPQIEWEILLGEQLRSKTGTLSLEVTSGIHFLL